MELIFEALRWLVAGENWGGYRSIPTALTQHLSYTLGALIIAFLLATPLGFLVGHTRKGRTVTVWITSTLRSIPTLGLVTIAGLLFGVGFTAPLLALVILGIPTIFAGAYSGVEAIDSTIIDSAKAQGFTHLQVLWRVEIPLGLPVLWGALRSATLQIVSTATLAAYVGAGGLGSYMFLGLRTQNYPLMLASSILVLLLAAVFEGFFILGSRYFFRGFVSGYQDGKTPDSSPPVYMPGDKESTKFLLSSSRQTGE